MNQRNTPAISMPQSDTKLRSICNLCDELFSLRFELSEECRLRGGTWVKLIPDEHPGIMEAKWAATRFTPFLVLDPEADPDAREPDVEEFIEQVDASVDEVEESALSGMMHLPSSQTVLMALRALRSRSLL
mmetsp:Transcript_51766/g.135054  ORF Transcript_51766/g.135054 Transcript_51766/m.135054 type:complete len:131 (-) Transcript_51766:44-436(-)